MLEESSRSLELEKVVTLNGMPFLDSLPLENEALIPEDPFEDASPDETEYEGYMGNVRQSFYLGVITNTFPGRRRTSIL